MQKWMAESHRSPIFGFRRTSIQIFTVIELIYISFNDKTCATYFFTSILKLKHS